MDLGYVYSLHDPLKKRERQALRARGMTDEEAIAECKDIVYVGAAFHPWETLDRYITEPPNKGFRTFITNVYKKCDGLVIPDGVMCDLYYGTIDDLDFDILADYEPGVWWLEWRVLDEISPAGAMDNQVRTLPRLKQDWINRLQEEGHDLVNRKSGRPKGKSRVKWARVASGAATAEQAESED